MQGTAERQQELFGANSLNQVREVKRLMHLAADACNLSRDEIADRMNRLIVSEGLRTRGRDGLVSRAMLDKWLAPDNLDDLIPWKLLPVFCRVVRSLAPLRPLAGCLGGAVIGQEDQVLLRWAHVMWTRKKAARQERLLADQYEELSR
jgi:hypothetical protein